MILYLASFSLFVLSGRYPLKPFPRWVNELRLMFFLFWGEFLLYSAAWLKESALLSAGFFLRISFELCASSSSFSSSLSRSTRKERSSEMPYENADLEPKPMSILDLPELVLDCVMEKLSPAELRSLAGAGSRSLRGMCEADHQWRRRLTKKWEGVLGEAARDRLERFVSARKANNGGGAGEAKVSLVDLLLSATLGFSSPRKPADIAGAGDPPAQPPNSMMARYLALESGRFWFPAQVYNREKGQAGFMLSCYDAEISYDKHTDSFYARFPPHGKRASTIEEGVGWDRIRAPAVNTTAHELHVSGCRDDLRPGDHIEIQWRRNKEFPYGWWYAIVGHLESCDGDEHHCRCHYSDTIILEFNQFERGSRWRRASVNRNDHHEQGNELDGLYGGIRKLHDKDEISVWRRTWPAQSLW